MDDLIKSLLSENFINIENLLLSTTLRTEDYYKCIHYFIYQYIHNNLNDNHIFIIAYLLIHKFRLLSITGIYHIKHLIDWHKNNNYIKRRTYIFFDLYNSLLIIENKLTCSMKSYKMIKSNLFKARTITSLDDFREIIKNNVFPVIHSFDDNFLNYPIDNFNNRYHEAYMVTQTNEMLNRLRMLVKYFGLEILRSNGIEIMACDDFMFMDFTGRMQYYKTCLNKIILATVSIERCYCIRTKLISDINNFDREYELLKNNTKTDII